VKITSTTFVTKNQPVYIVKEKYCNDHPVIWHGPMLSEYLGPTHKGHVHFRYGGSFLVFPVMGDNEAIDFCDQKEGVKYHVFDSIESANNFILRFYDLGREVTL
jgi:hypothetical protein